ncbi:D-alanyl-lipoteichoic acid biosynthesis protein DltB [Neobacillus sp. OS1-33]|uniref:D-alanyl-lipoteichoic acid biosynthesis protein DltB n=1 Tax=Neobacillus sp. OS1-33 TaxID=3070683 RepID=UPI0027E028D5|nr:D-alanyl-lipoteichoic acid biosynthesis protein DltB [Neobacillus sp. OS1-33]WML26841.1 D-alanyl-lipoteichoic acid biosynthesis protein DltB [Neobacillus sp. OS1-33]
MTPYATLLYFMIVGILLIPVVAAGYRQKRLGGYNAFVTVVILFLAFGADLHQAYSLMAYVIWEIILVSVYLRYRSKQNSSLVFYLAIFLSIIPLLLIKILPAFELNNWFGFLGISYLTFKNIQMVIDIRDGSLKSLTLKEQLSFLLFFPTISSGPIDRYKRFKKDIDTVPSGEEYHELLYKGINKIFLGFLYKFIIGFLINSKLISTLFIQNHTLLSDISYMYLYSLYLFFDFAGYSNFAIGFSYIMGVKTPENFNLPFLSRNIKDFWNRWHMSLSFWFRDYVYMRFAFLMQKKKWIKNRFTISYLGYLLLFLLMGVWHGLELHYIVYGLYHALLIISFDWFTRKNKKYSFWKKNKWTHAISIVITFHFVCFGFLIFSGRLF